MTEHVRIEVVDGVATIRVDRPPMNALSSTVQDAIGRAAVQVAGDPEVAAVVITGGDALFAAGADVKEMAGMAQADLADRAARVQEVMRQVAAIPQPTVAAITGYALGAGLELALSCDVRIAAEDATLGLPEILLGLIPGAGGTQRLPRLVGTSRAKEMIFSGRPVGAERALEIGLVDQVVAPDKVQATAHAWAQRFVGGPSRALRAAKEAIDRGVESDLASGLALESALFTSVFATDDRASGMASFIEHGPGKATFTGR